LERRSDHSSEIYKGLIKDLQKLDEEIDTYQKMLVEVSRPTLVTTIANIFGGKKNTKRRKTRKNKTRKSYKKK